ncbi:MAG: hypothetical protein GYA18_08455 [Chloroflexi bacterium]|nr:hypothetical protein [Chloroflexota bacterium]
MKKNIYLLMSIAIILSACGRVAVTIDTGDSATGTPIVIAITQNNNANFDPTHFLTTTPDKIIQMDMAATAIQATRIMAASGSGTNAVNDNQSQQLTANALQVDNGAAYNPPAATPSIDELAEVRIGGLLSRIAQAGNACLLYTNPNPDQPQALTWIEGSQKRFLAEVTVEWIYTARVDMQNLFVLGSCGDMAAEGQGGRYQAQGFAVVRLNMPNGKMMRRLLPVSVWVDGGALVLPDFNTPLTEHWKFYFASVGGIQGTIKDSQESMWIFPLVDVLAGGDADELERIFQQLATTNEYSPVWLMPVRYAGN